MSPGNRRSTQSIHNIRPLPAIAEDEDVTPSLPEKSARRSVVGLGNTREAYHLFPPPAYSIGTPSSHGTESSSSEPESSMKYEEVGWFVKRGGWYRVALIVFVAAACIMAVAIGLTMGLKRERPSSSGPGGNPGPIDHLNSSLLLPTGSYAFTAALSSISTACTSNPNTFRCYPYTIYNSSQSESSVTFHWIIAQVSSYAYTISSAPNPFVPRFTNVSLNVLDSNQTSERLTFNFSMNAAVVPASPLNTTTNASATCYFNNTIMSATIWTRKPAEYPRNLTSSVSSGGNGTQTSTTFDNWPYAVEVSQVAGSGPDTPDCRDSGGNSVGSYDLPAGTTGDCSCSYRNFGLGL